MKVWFSTLNALLLGTALALSHAAAATDLSAPVVLVSSSRLDGSPYQQVVVVAAPLPNGGGHIGLIVNRPTSFKLETLLPDDTAARNVSDHVYVGGPALARGLFAVMRKAPDGAEGVVPLVDGLVAVMDGATIDRILQSTPNDARYFLGMMLWAPDELENEVEQSAWDVRACGADQILSSDSTGLWKSLHQTVSAALAPSAARRPA